MQEIIDSIGTWFDPETAKAVLMLWGSRVLAALAIFFIGRWVVGRLVHWFKVAADRAAVDETLVRFMSNLIRMTLLVFVLLTAVGALGVPTTNFLAILGAAGLAIGLALKDSLANFSSGIMLVIFRPFHVGDYVECAGVAGNIEQIGIFNTLLVTPDNRVIIVPNSLVFGGNITNYSARPTRRIDLVIGIGYADAIPAARKLIQGVIDAHERVLRDPAPKILLLELAESSVNIAVRPWVNTSDYWVVRGELLERIKSALEDNGLSIPFPQRDVHLYNATAANA
jgi:small conductance mechanosensitive channel